jgi:hypothetical protein
MKVNIGTLKIHDKLNSSLWGNFNLKPDVRESLIAIAEEFYKFLEIDAPIKDIKFTGSLANFNYTTKSDIDLHLVIDFDTVDQNFDLVRRYFNIAKNLWNGLHSITIHGFDVELYVEAHGETHVSTGMFSVANDEWIIQPRRKVTEVDDEAAKHKAGKFRDEILAATDMESGRDKMLALHSIKKKLKKMRKCGLERGGEFSAENITFKILRHDGALGKLHNSYNREYDKLLSLPEAQLHEEEPFQKAVKRKHTRMKYRLIGQGKNRKREKGHTGPSYKRSKSAPPGAGGA